MDFRNVMLCFVFKVVLYPSLAESYENVALNKPAWQQYSFNTFSAERAVDGEKSKLAVYGGQCAVSIANKTTEWRVDLGNVFFIHHIIIQFATNNGLWGDEHFLNSHFLGFSVMLSNTTNKDDWILCFRDTKYTTVTIPNPVNIACSYYGRYVIYYNKRTHEPYPDGYSDDVFHALCEVEVFCIPLRNHQGDVRLIIAAALVSTCVATIIVIVFIRIRISVKGRNEIQNCKHLDVTEYDSTVTRNAGESRVQSHGNIIAFEEMELTPRPESYELIAFPEESIDETECRNVKTIDHTSKANYIDYIDTDDARDLISESETYAIDESISIISIKELQCLLKKMKEKSNGNFKTGYTSLPSGEQHFCTVGKQHENIPKNRYKTALPYDHSRVILKRDNESSDYINASYIYDNYQKNQYIATQGPRDNTINDFWKMISQENVTQIVMLTNLEEGEKIKCSKYWPDYMTSEVHGNITIVNDAETYCAFYIIRKLVLSLNKESRVVMQYHFTAWPDHGTPDPLELVVFHSHVMSTQLDADKAPVVVHCSAGIGRTGTYIALDALYKEGKRTGKINVAEYVKVMRSNRVNMVQTYEQYMTIFIALKEEFKASVVIERVPDFVKKIESLISTPENQTIQKEFEKLLQIRQEYTGDDYKEAEQFLSNTKDRVLPLDKYVLYLTSLVSNRGSFINAIHVSSFLQTDAFIVTKYPTPEDAVDFLRLLIDHESDTVICMDPLSGIKSSSAWLPGFASVKAVTPFSVQHVGEIHTDVKVTNLRILGRDGLSHPIAIIEPRGVLKPGESSQDTSSLLSLVSYALRRSTEGPITIVSKDGASLCGVFCRDGASLCGVFCAVFNSVQQINMDDSVDVFTTVRQLQTRRPEFCSTLDEYWLVCRALRYFIGTMSENVYYNL